MFGTLRDLDQPSCHQLHLDIVEATGLESQLEPLGGPARRFEFHGIGSSGGEILSDVSSSTNCCSIIIIRAIYPGDRDVSPEFAILDTCQTHQPLFVSSGHRLCRRGGDHLVQRVGPPLRAIPDQVVDRGEVDGYAIEVGGLKTLDQARGQLPGSRRRVRPR